MDRLPLHLPVTVSGILDLILGIFRNDSAPLPLQEQAGQLEELGDQGTAQEAIRQEREKDHEVPAEDPPEFGWAGGWGSGWSPRANQTCWSDLRGPSPWVSIGADGKPLPLRPPEPLAGHGSSAIRRHFSGCLPFSRSAAATRVKFYKSSRADALQNFRKDNSWDDLFDNTRTSLHKRDFQLAWNDNDKQRDRDLEQLHAHQWSRIQMDLCQYDHFQEPGGLFIQRPPSFSGPMVGKLLFIAHHQHAQHVTDLLSTRRAIGELNRIVQSLQHEEIRILQHIDQEELHIQRLERLEEFAYDFFDSPD